MKRIIPIHHEVMPRVDSITPMNTPMELIIKPTEACNFKCTFCSSSDISAEHSQVLDLERVFTFLTRFPQTNTIIVNGGDPLMVPPSYYWRIIEFLDVKNLPANLSLTSNLWAFYKKPEKWVELFKHPRVGVATSFNYGNTRLIDIDRPYTEDDFWNVSDTFFEHVGYRPDFISVITDENERTAVDNVLLAKAMGVECKLNYAMSSGRQLAPYQLSKIYQTYVQIYKRNLWYWEYNTKQMMRRLTQRTTTCPQNRSCDTNIRAMNPGGDYYSCGSFGDDKLFPIDFKSEMRVSHVAPLQTELDLFSMKDDCLACLMFDICNGCRKTIYDTKRAGLVEEHCSLMKTIAQDIIAINEAHKNDTNKVGAPKKREIN
jgi:radical SAM protein with 4Fe4S-binding SPASM domain